MSNVRNAYWSSLAALSRMFGSSLFGRRHSWLYMCGVIPFTRLSPALLLDEVRYQAGKLQEIGYPEQRAALADDDLWIGRDYVGPLPRHRADVLLVDAPQEPRPVPVVPLAHADELPSAERVERVRHAHKARARERRACSSR
ncbi:hypothetical protein WMF04_37560 [Sorangium sp. So ce260]